MSESVGSWTIRLIGRTLEVAVGNPYALVRFGPRCGRAALVWAGDLLSPRVGAALGPVTAQIGRSFFRGIWVVIGLGLAMSVGLRAAGEAIGPMIAPIAENAAVKILVSDGLPLMLAVFLSGRAGATMAAKLGPLAPLRGLPQMTLRTEDVREMVLPSLWAAPITAAAFYYIVLLVASAGYHAIGPLPWSAADSFQLTVPDVWRPGLENGLLKSGVFGFAVTYTGAALGVQSAEGYRQSIPETHEVHRAVWESSILGVVLCLFVSVIWSSLD